MLTIYKASAGSGKTFTLAYRYIKMLLGVKPEGSDRYVLNMRKYLGGMAVDRRPHSHILAITFTNKATAEMKGRIIRELDALSRIPSPGEPDAAYAPMLTTDYGCSRAELAEVAARSLAALLHDYGSFNVSTIDAFFQTILRTFAREIDRQGDFRLELDNAYVMGAALSMLFDDLNDGRGRPNRAVVKWLEQMSSERVLSGTDFNPFNRGGSMYRSLIGGLLRTFSEDFEARSQQVHDYLSDPGRLERFGRGLDEAVERLRNEEKALTSNLISALACAGVPVDRLKSPLRTLVVGAAAEGLGAKEGDRLADPNATQKYISALAARDYSSSDLFLKAPKGAPAPGAAAYEALFGWYEAICPVYVRRRVLPCVKSRRDSLWALSYINDYVNRFRQENNMILLADTNSLLRTIISEDETPFIYERVGQELRHFLIDEFQDTSRLQWDNLRPLIANSLASLNDSLIIGDEKQSIYRWRGGDPTLLASRVADGDFPGLNDVRGDAPGENTNYRSAHDIVRFNNALFAALAERGGIAGYEGITQSLPSKTASLGAWIVLSHLSDENLERAPELYLDADRIADMEARGVPVTAANVALERCGMMITDQHARGYRWRDIAILCRRNSDAAMIVDYMMANFPEVKIMSDEALLVRNSGAVKLVVSILEIIDKSYSGAEAVTEGAAESDGPVRYRTGRDCGIMTDRFEYFVAHGHTPDEALSMALDPSVSVAVTGDGCGSLTDDLRAIRELAPANLVALVEAVIERKVPPARRAAELAYISAFVDAVMDFSANYNPSLHAFLEYWSSHSDVLTIGSGAGQDAVSVMTVHKAKGLEWDCVHIPLMNWALEADADSQWFSTDGLDEIPAEDRPPLMYLDADRFFGYDGSPFAAQTRRQVEDDTADNLNVAYVGFTRAVRELHIHMTEARGDGGSLRRAIVSLSAGGLCRSGELYIDPGEYADELGNVCIGAPTYPEARGCDDGALAPPPYAVSFTALNKRMARLEDLTMRSDDDMDPDIGNGEADREIVDRGDGEAVREAARNGMNMHAILARMATAGDLDAAIRAEARTMREGDAEVYREVLGGAFEAAGDMARLWFDADAPRVLTEQPVYLAERNESFRPDRIVWTREGTVDVVDYKFTSEVLDSHLRQVRGYAAMLRDMGYGPVRAFLWYPAMRRIVEVE